jgi:hypothetical protein
MQRSVGLPFALLSVALVACSQTPPPHQTNTLANPSSSIPATNQSVTSSGTAQQITTPTTSANAVQAYVDPATGELRAPTEAEQAAQIKQRSQATAASSSSTPVKVTSLPNGMTEYDLGSRSNVNEAVCIQSDGSLGECSAAERAELFKQTKKKAP